MFAFSQIEPQTTGRISRWDVPLNTWLGVKFGEGQDATVGRAWERFMDDQFAQGDIISPEEANDTYKLPGLKFDRPMPNSQAQHMYERKREELARLAYLEAASHSAISGKGIAGFGAMLLGGLSHPIDAGLIFMPIVGSSGRAASLAKTGAGSMRQALARGLITTEQVAHLSKFPRFTSAVIEGTIGQAIVEIPVYAQKRRDQAIYGIEDAIINVVAGGAFAGGIHAAAKGLSRALEISGLAHQRLTPETKGLIQREAVQAFVEGRPIDIRDHVHVDEAAIRARVEQDLRVEISTRVNADEVRVRLKQEGLTDADIDAITAGATVESVVSKRLGIDETGRASTMIVEENANGSRSIGFSPEAGPAATTPRNVGQMSHVDAILLARDTAVERINNILGSNPTPERIADTRQARIQEAINNQMPERLAAARQAEISRQQAEGRILSDEQIEAYKADPTAENAAAFLDEDISTIEQDLKADNDRRLAELGDETDEAVAAERAALKEELDAELAELKESAYQPRDKAVKAAIPCAMEVIGGQ